MSNLHLLLKSLVIILLVTVTAHLFAAISYVDKEENEQVVTSPPTIHKENTAKTIDTLPIVNSTKNINSTPDATNSFEKKKSNPLIGKWEVFYAEQDYTIIYEMKEDNGLIKAYPFRYKNNEGTVAIEDKKNAVLTIKDTLGSAIYLMEFEGEKYNIPSTIKMISNSKIELNYEYYDYSGTETWNKITK